MYSEFLTMTRDAFKKEISKKTVKNIKEKAFDLYEIQLKETNKAKVIDELTIAFEKMEQDFIKEDQEAEMFMAYNYFEI